MSGFLLARAPLEGTVAANVLKHATGALNIDACRVGMSDEDAEFIRKTARPNSSGDVHVGSVMNRPAKVSGANVHDGGRWPANLLLEHAEKCAKTGDSACEEGCPAQTLDHQSGSSFSAGGRIGKKTDGIVAGVPAGEYEKGDPGFGDGGGASRYFRSDSSPEARLNYVLRLIIRENGVLLDLTGEAEPGWCDVWRAALQSSADSPATPE